MILVALVELVEYDSWVVQANVYRIDHQKVIDASCMVVDVGPLDKDHKVVAGVVELHQGMDHKVEEDVHIAGIHKTCAYSLVDHKVNRMVIDVLQQVVE